MKLNCSLKPSFLTLNDNISPVANSYSSGFNTSIGEKQPYFLSTSIDLTKVPSKANCSISSRKSNNEANYDDDSINPKKNQFNDYKYKSKDYLINKKVNSNSSSVSSHQRKKFSPEEDMKLTAAIAINGPKKWDQIALSLPGRTGRQCRDRFHNYLNPSLTNGPWTREEDKLLEQKVGEIGQHWNKIVRFFRGRSPNNIKNRWYTYLCKQKQNQINKFSEQNVPKNSKELHYFNNDVQSVNCSGYFSNNNFDINKIGNSNNNYYDYPNISFITIDKNVNDNGSLKNISTDCENDYDIFVDNKSKNRKKILFPPIYPPSSMPIPPSNQNMFSFLSPEFRS